MIMNGIILVWLLSLQGLGAVKELQNHPDCGWTAIYPREAIAGGKRIQPNEYSWLASLQYGYGGTFADDKVIIVSTPSEESINNNEVSYFVLSGALVYSTLPNPIGKSFKNLLNSLNRERYLNNEKPCCSAPV